MLGRDERMSCRCSQIAQIIAQRFARYTQEGSQCDGTVAELGVEEASGEERSGDESGDARARAHGYVWYEVSAVSTV